jgi:hypothetical protein
MESNCMKSDWEEERFGEQLWDAVTAVERGDRRGMAVLAELDQQGSTLAPLYWAFFSNREEGANYPSESAQRVALERSARRGSIEARMRLARVYDLEGEDAKSEIELRQCSRKGFPPAQFILGLGIARGQYRSEYPGEGDDLLNEAAEAGHIPAGKWKYHLMARNASTSKEVAVGLWMRFVMMIKSYWFATSRKKDERFRIWC